MDCWRLVVLWCIVESLMHDVFAMKSAYYLFSISKNNTITGFASNTYGGPNATLFNDE